jgi:hypothetical protein
MAGTPKRILFICGSMNQTTQMHQVAKHLAEYEQVFTPYFCDGHHELMRRMKMMEFTIIGDKLAKRCWKYLEDNKLAIDYRAMKGPYDLVVTCSDVYIQKNISKYKIVLVQEGITDPRDRLFRLVQRNRWMPRWVAGTAATGLSGAYRRFCVASAGYAGFFAENGADPGKMVVTGIPNFDNCARYRNNTFPHRNYVLACTSPLREIFRREDRPAFIRQVVEIAKGRPIFFKFHPNENMPRATREVERYAPGAKIYTSGNAEEMIANCDVLVTRYSSTVFVGLALGKETHSDYDMDVLRRLCPEQNGRAAENIAQVCRGVLEGDGVVGSG